MLICSKWVKEVFPNCDIIVCTAGNSRFSYIPKLTGGLVKSVVSIYPEPEADLIIHGGGGTYFDFQPGNWKYYLLNKLINGIGFMHFSTLLKRFRLLKGWPAGRDRIRIGLGIGVGNFVFNSKKYFVKAAELADFDLMITRDRSSFKRLKEKHLKAEIWNSTDLAFLKEYWAVETDTGIKVDSDQKRVGFVIRWWKMDQSYLETIHQCAGKLAADGYLVSIYVFEKELDQPVSEMFNDFNRYIWDPKEIGLSKYLELFGRLDLVVTSRAHGAILASAMDIPSVCIGIDPKLRTFHDMLPNGSSYVECPLLLPKLMKSIDTTLRIPAEVVRDDFAANRRIAVSSMALVKKWLQNRVDDIKYQAG